MKRKALYFNGEGAVEVREESVPKLKPDEVMVSALISAVSPGSEMLIYHGQVSSGTTVDSTISALEGNLTYPLKYGYCMVGRVIEAGRMVDSSWLGSRVFCLHPHESVFAVRPEDLLTIPVDLGDEDAVLYASMETAVNLVMDAGPLIGEEAGVYGQGVVGLLTVALLARFPLNLILSFDLYELRRRKSLEMGAHYSLDPRSSETPGFPGTPVPGYSDFDLTFELTGDPGTLNQAVASTGYEGRVIIGSWYGTKSATLKLGTRFHRSKMKLISSQVSHLRSEFTGRWDRKRRGDLVMSMLSQAQPSDLISHRYPIEQAGEAYAGLAKHPEEFLQVIFTYQN